MSTLEKCKEDGRRAFEMGNRYTDCPFLARSKMRANWQIGWEKAARTARENRQLDATLARVDAALNEDDAS